MNVIIMQIIVVLTNIYIATTENKKNIYIATFLFNFFNLLMYLLNQDTTTAILYIVISGRSFIYIYKDKLKNIIIPIVTPCLVCYYMWFAQTTQNLRVWNAVCNGLWCIYNFNAFAFFGK